MITKEEIERLAVLSRISLSPEETAVMQKDIGSILSYVEQIKTAPSLDETDQDLFGEENIMRNDGSPHENGLFTEALLRAAPEREGQYLKVKKILSLS